MANDFPVYEFIDGDLSRGLLLICDHARNTLPERYGSLGLAKREFERHIAYDIGAEDLTRGLAAKLGVPAVLATFSRLLIDPNRGEDDPTLVRQLSDGSIISGNYPLSAEELAVRLENFHKPYHQAIEAQLARFVSAGVTPAIFSVHTMTDKWNGKKRPWHCSILWDQDPRFAIALIKALQEEGDITVGDNQPYDGALGGDTLFRHGTANGFSHALLEIRQDLVNDQAGIDGWVDRLTPLVEKVNAEPHNHAVRFFGTRTGFKLVKAKDGNRMVPASWIGKEAEKSDG